MEETYKTAEGGGAGKGGGVDFRIWPEETGFGEGLRQTLPS